MTRNGEIFGFFVGGPPGDLVNGSVVRTVWNSLDIDRRCTGQLGLNCLEIRTKLISFTIAALMIRRV